jgi:hypothetical protein
MNTLEVHRSNPPIALEAKLCDPLVSPEKATTVIDWLLWWALVRAGEHQLAERMRESSLEQITEGGFAEY